MGPPFASPVPPIGAGYAAGPSAIPPFVPQAPPMMPPFAPQPGFGAAPALSRYPPSFPQAPIGLGPVLPPSIQPPVGYNKGVPAFPSFPVAPSAFPPSSGYAPVAPQLPITPPSQIIPAAPPMPFVPPVQQYGGAQPFPQAVPATLPDFGGLGGAQQIVGSSYSAPLTGMTGDIPTFGVPPAQQGYDSSSALTGAQFGGASAAPQLPPIGGGAGQYGSAPMAGAPLPQLGGAAPQFPQIGAPDAQSSYGSPAQSIGSAAPAPGNFIPIFPGASSAPSIPGAGPSYSAEQAPPAPGSNY